MDALARNLAVLAIIVPVVVSCLCIYNGGDWLIAIISIWIFYPCICWGLYIMKSRTGSKWINGVDISKYTEEELEDLMGLMGLCIAIGSAIMAIGLAFILESWLGIVLLIATMIIGIALIVMPILINHPGRVRKFPEVSTSGLIITTVCISALAIAPLVYVSFTGTGGTVTVELDEDSFSYRAPMVDETFRYEEVEELALYDDFDRGKRIMGYGTNTIMSGKFRTSFFDETPLDYTLASYTKNRMCITFWVDGDLYALNQSTAEETQALYEDLKQRVEAHKGV